MSEAKGSDVRAACEAAAKQIAKLCRNSLALNHPSKTTSTEIIERYLTPLIEAHVQAAAVEMQERLCDWVAQLYSHSGCNDHDVFVALAEEMRRTLVPTNAYDAALLRARIETAEITLGWDKMQFLNQVAEWKRQLAALTQPAPERKEK